MDTGMVSVLVDLDVEVAKSEATAMLGLVGDRGYPTLLIG